MKLWAKLCWTICCNKISWQKVSFFYPSQTGHMGSENWSVFDWLVSSCCHRLTRQRVLQCSPEASAAGVFANYLRLKRRLLLLDSPIEKWFFTFYKTDTRFSNAAYLNFLAAYMNFLAVYLNFLAAYLNFLAAYLNFLAAYLNFLAAYMNFLAVYLNFLAAYLNFLAAYLNFLAAYLNFLAAYMNFLAVYLNFLAAYLNFLAAYFKICGEHCVLAGVSDSVTWNSSTYAVYWHFETALPTKYRIKSDNQPQQTITP